ncbi:hypothetical protein HY468_04600 [Candidatus Roizmanbacteria bacterium]|nr:hypothetical protein [Candidatus Roizmanbacteria bacterium]
MQGPDQTEPNSINKELPPGIARVSLTESRSGIPLTGWDGVRHALKTYVMELPDANIAVREFMQVSGPLSAYLPVLPVDVIVDDVLTEAESPVLHNGRWVRSYDYEGAPSFFKTRVGIQKVGTEEDYILYLANSFSGITIEEELADFLGIQRVVASKGVTIDFAVHDDTFQIDFTHMAKPIQQVVKSLDHPFPRRRMTGNILLKQFVFNRTFDYSPPPLVLGSTNGLEVTADLKNDWFGRFKHVGRVIQDTYQVHKSVVSGPLGAEHSEQTKSAPYLYFEITPQIKWGPDASDTTDPQVIANIDHLQRMIAEGFGKK